MFHKLRILAPTTISVLIEGETGTGKELVARALHDHSTRAGKPFVVLDCATIPAKLADRMLSGLETGNQPLRERTRDIDLLIRHMMDLAGRGPEWKRVTRDSLRELHRHDWPGNVRELRNLVAVALAHDEGGPIDLRVPLRESLEGRPARDRRYAVKGRASDIYGESKARHDRAFFTALFEATGGNLGQMGRRAQLSRETVRAYLKALRIGGYGK